MVSEERPLHCFVTFPLPSPTHNMEALGSVDGRAWHIGAHAHAYLVATFAEMRNAALLNETACAKRAALRGWFSHRGECGTGTMLGFS